MKSATLATAVSLAALLCAGAPVRPAGGAAQCPSVDVSCTDIIRIGEPLKFTADLLPAAGAAPLTFEWEVSAGSITSGQGTRGITVDTTGLAGRPVTAVVTVGGLPPGCPNRAACATAVPPPFVTRPLDTYGALPFEDEKARLDNFAIEMMNNPSARGYVVCYGGRRGRRGEAMARCARAKNHLVGARGLAPGRVALIDGGFRERLESVLWVLPPGMPPKPSPTVAPGEVEFVGAPKRRVRAQRRRR